MPKITISAAQRNSTAISGSDLAPEAESLASLPPLGTDRWSRTAFSGIPAFVVQKRGPACSQDFAEVSLVMNGEVRNFQPAGDPQLVTYVREVTLDSLSADRQIAGYSSVRAACGELADDFQLAARQAEAAARRLSLGWK